MAYGLEFSEEAVIQLERIDKTTTKRILKKIESVMSDPQNFFKRLSGRPEYKLRVGAYRIIADIDDSEKKVFIRTVGNRKNIYGKL
ncbi:ParE toxin of type II toxin-antitoxin system, parDE [uncultured archaeon]|nr:ParE toxin of type II toxin-antitoxin system, parDE [uncultured archaeon]